MGAQVLICGIWYYILSMVMLEVSQALKETADEEEDDAAR